MARDPTARLVPLEVDPMSRFVTDPDERWLAATDRAGRLRVWAVGGEPDPVSLPNTLSEQASFNLITLGPRGLLAAAADRSVQVWDLPSAYLQTELQADSTVTAVAFSADGRRLAVGTADGSVGVWLVAPPRLNAELASKALRLTRAEATVITSMEPLIRTPRSARRLINTYRLLRAGLSPEELDRLRSQDHGTVVLMLAMLIGFPQQSSELLEELMSGTGSLPGTLSELIRSRLRTTTSPRMTRGLRLHSAPSHDLRMWRQLEAAIAKVRAPAKSVSTS
jgi:WD40 repeat protein